MEGFKHLSFIADDGLIEDLALSYTPEQFHHHVAVQELFAYPPLGGVERWAWAQWHWKEFQFHIDAIHPLGLPALEQVDSRLLPTSVKLPAPLVIVDTDQSVSASTLGGQPLTRIVTIGDAMPFCVLFNRDVEVSLMILQVFLTL
jgi:hypothetical protein